jgi:hypothetical protein
MSSSNLNTVRPIQPPRPNRWVPVEVWQSKGLTAQEMTLPQGKIIEHEEIRLLTDTKSYFRCFNPNELGRQVENLSQSWAESYCVEVAKRNLPAA